jgi:hypothetical protein
VLPSRPRLAAVVVLVPLVLTGCSTTDEPDTTTTPAPTTSPASAPSPSSAAPTSPPTATTNAATRTVVTVPVDGCDTCTIEAWAQISGTSTSLGQRKIADGVPRWPVPVNRTRGMAFTLTTPDGLGTGNARTVVVVQYRDQAVGAEVSRTDAATAEEGSFCWAGTSSDRVTLRVTVDRFDDTVLGEATSSLRAYLSPTARGLPPFTRATNGAMGVQDDPTCIA